MTPKRAWLVCFPNDKNIIVKPTKRKNLYDVKDIITKQIIGKVKKCK